MRRSYGSRVDADGVQHKRVSDAVRYERVTTLWTRTVGSGRIRCELLRANKPAVRLVQLVAEYVEAGCVTSQTVRCSSPEEELAEAGRLERIILQATVRPAG